MDSKSTVSITTTTSTESELNLRMSSSSSSNTSDSDSYDDELPALRRSRKELDLRVYITQCPSTESTDSLESLKPKNEPKRTEDMGVLWCRRSPKPSIEDFHEEDRTVTCSVLKTHDLTVNSYQSLDRNSEDAGMSANRVSQFDMASDSRVKLSRSSSHPIINPVKTLRDLSEEAFVRMAGTVRAAPSFDILRDVNGRVDMRYLLYPKDESITEDINSSMQTKNTRGGMDITYPLQDFPLIDIQNVGYPIMLDGVAKMNLGALKNPGSADLVGISLPSDEPSGKIEFGTNVDQDCQSNVILIRSAHASCEIANPKDGDLQSVLKHATPERHKPNAGKDKNCQDIITSLEPAEDIKTAPLEINKSYTTRRVSRKDTALQPAERPRSCPSLVEGFLRSTSPMNKDQHVSFLLSTSEFDIAYAAGPKESEEESPIHPGIKSPKFSAENTTPVPSLPPQVWDASDMKFIQLLKDTNCVPDEFRNNQSASAPISPILHQVYVVQTTAPNARNNSAFALPAANETEQAISPGANTDQHSGLESISNLVKGTASVSLLETLQHSGSVRLLENLPGVDGQWGQFGQLPALPTPQEEHELEEEMLKLATRAKRYVPPIEVGLFEWDSIVKILAMNEPVSVERVLCWLCKITTKRYCDLVRLFRCGLYDKVLYLLFNYPDSTLIQNLTIKLIAELCILPECSLQILQNPRLILLCITLLEDDNSSLHFHEFSSKILSAIGHDRSIQRALLCEHNLIEVLLRRIINSPDPDVRCNCLELLIRVATKEATCKRLIASEQFSLALFYTLIESKYAKIQQLGLGMWELFTRFDTSVEFQTSVQSSGLPEFLIKILLTESLLDFSHLAVAIFSNMGNTTFGLSFLQQSGAAKFLVDYIDQPGKEGLLGCGLDIIVKLSVSKTGRALLVEFEVPFRLVKYLKYDEDATLERTCVSIANVCQNLEALSTIAANKPAEDLIRLIYEDQSTCQLKYSAARALFELAGRSETICRQITEFHLMRVFHHLIWSGYSHFATLASISDTIQIISQYPGLKGSMIDSENVACLLDIIQGHCRESAVDECVPEDAVGLRINAMQCLRCYMSDPLCRNIFADAYGVCVLLENLKSPSILIRQATALFIDLAAQDSSLALQMVTAGIIPIMRNDTAMMIACPAWKKALQQVYDHHLPSKFAYCRRLEIKDVTMEGFYIAATAKGNIEILDNLLRDKRCPLETLYVCNFMTAHAKPDGPAHVWQPNIKTSNYSGAFADLGQRSVARIWQRKVILLYDALISPELSRESSLELGDASGRSLNSLNGQTSKSQGPPPASVPNTLVTPQSSETKNLEIYGVCPIDNDLGQYLDDLLKEMKEKMGEDDEDEEDSRYSFLADKGLVKAVEILAKFVVLRMSGSSDAVTSLISIFKMSVWELKEKYELNILPFGHLKAGLHLERSLLFKILSDKIGLPCSLVRGEYGIAFNEICVPCPNNEFPVPWKEMRPNYVVDLMQNVGDIYFLGSWEATEYCNVPY